MAPDSLPLTPLQKRAVAICIKTGLVDAKWYGHAYPDAMMLGMDPVEHFVRYGLLMQRDPNPDMPLSFLTDAVEELAGAPPFEMLASLTAGVTEKLDAGRVLWAANRLAEHAGFDRAIALATRYLPPHLQPSVNILQANKLVETGDHAGWLAALNSYLQSHHLTPLQLSRTDGNVLANIVRPDLPQITQGRKVSVLMPVFKAEATIRYAIQSILDQTWQQLEIIAIDDASPDGTWPVLQQMAQEDPRLIVLRNAQNVGPYVTKNIGLQIATGTYVTGHDSDDYALPDRIERQVQFLEQNTCDFILSGMLRMHETGYVTRINPAGLNTEDGVCTTAFISLMARRDVLQGVYGHWDEVRFSGDSELIRRVQTIEKRIIPRLHVPTMLTLDHPSGLTNHETQGMSAKIRRTYRQRFSKWHQALNRRTAYLPFPQSKRMFMTDPDMLNPAGAVAKLKTYYDTVHSEQVLPVTRCDVAIITDLRFPGGNCSSTLDEAAFFKNQGLSVRLIKCPVDGDLQSARAFMISDRYDPWQPEIKMWYDLGRLECRHLIIRHPLVAVSRTFARIADKCQADHAHIVINNAVYKATGEQIYKPEKLQAVLDALPIAQKQIVPISTAIRKGLQTALPKITLGAQNWSPTFDVADYANPPKGAFEPPFRLGRHGRDGAEKWIETTDALRQIYPDHPDFVIEILGGAKHAQKIMNGLPKNWTVHDFGAIAPRDYLRQLDAFVYFPNTQLQEAFGRTIVEAMISTRPCILPARFAETFQDLAFYTEPRHVAGLVRAIQANWPQCQQFLDCVQKIAIANFASDAIANRMPDIMNSSDHTPYSATGLELPAKMRAFKLDIEKQATKL